MEKFRSTADPSTGVHPFLPPRHPQNFPSIAFGSVVFLLRAPFFFIFLALYATVSLLTRLVPIPRVSRILERIIDSLILPPLAISLGLWSFRHPLLEKSRVRGVSSEAHPTSGDIILVNHSSPLDALYLAYCYSPAFVVPCSEGLIHLSTISAFLQVGCTRSFRGKTTSLSALTTTKSAPIVLFAEGCTTNGRGVLQFPVSTGSLLPARNLYALGLRYSSDRRECYTVGSFPKHLLRMMMSSGCRIYGHLTAVAPGSTNVQSTVASLAGVPCLRIGMEAGLRFSEHWRDKGV